MKIKTILKSMALIFVSSYLALTAVDYVTQSLVRYPRKEINRYAPCGGML